MGFTKQDRWIYIMLWFKAFYNTQKPTKVKSAMDKKK